MTLQLGLEPGPWVQVRRTHDSARELADRHYSRQTIGAEGFMPPGRTFVLVSRCERALWGVVENKDPAGALRWRCSIFRNEGAGRSSALIVDATARTFDFWRARGELPATPLSTEIDPSKVKHKRDPGRCFRRAGWTVHGWTTGGHGRTKLLVLIAPGEADRLALPRPPSRRPMFSWLESLPEIRRLSGSESNTP